MSTRHPVEYCVAGKELQITGRILKIARLKSEFYVQLDNPNSFVEALKRSDVRTDIMTLFQGVNDPVPRYSFHCESEKLAVLKITTYEAWFKTQLYNKPRNMIRKALKSGIEVRLEELSDSLLRGIKAIYDESPIRQGRRNRHYKKDLETIKVEHSALLERSQFIVAYCSGEIVGFAKITFCQGSGIVMNFLSKLSHRDKAVNNAILAKAVELCAGRNLKCLVYGVWGSGGAGGFNEFKTANGFECVEVPRYFIPMTWFGKISVKVGAHRGLAHHMPQWFVKAAAKGRARWNTWRLKAVQAA